MSSIEAWALPPDSVLSGEVKELPVEAGGGRIRFFVPDPGWLAGLAARVASARDRSLLERSAAEIARILGRVGRRFLDPEDPLRVRALRLLPSLSGLSDAMAREVLDGMAADWTGERLLRLLDVELGGPDVLDRFVTGPSGGRRRAVGPRLGFHVCAGTVPGVSVTSLIRGLLVKSGVVLKPGRSDALLPVLFARALAEEDADLARAVAVLYWPGGRDGSAEAEDALLADVDAVVVYGGDEAVRSIRDRTPVTSRFVAYRHRVSAAMVGRDSLAGPDDARAAARRTARSVALFDQRGCVSPHVVYVERGGVVGPEEWARALADAFRTLEGSLPSGPLRPGEASELHQLRGSSELLAAAGRGGPVFHGGRAPWTVLVEEEPGFRPSCLGRVVRVRPVDALFVGVAELDEVGRFLQTISLEGAGTRREKLAEALARAGAVRITTPAAAPWPPPWWPHDGNGPLRALLRWVELEGG